MKSHLRGPVTTHCGRNMGSIPCAPLDEPPSCSVCLKKYRADKMKKNSLVQFWISNSDMDEVRAAAAASGDTVSQWFRKAMRGELLLPALEKR